MITPQTIDLTPTEAADLIHNQLVRAGEAMRTTGLDAALDSYVRALGLSLQLGPAPTEQVLVAVLQTVRELAFRHDAHGLSALGPALVGLVAQVRESDALPPTAPMEAWATVATDLGTLIGQVGLALAIPIEHQDGMMDNARARAALLDEATGSLFALTAWIDKLHIRG